MKKNLSALTVAVLGVCIATKTFAVSMAIDSLTGPVTTNEINSFKTYMATQTPSQTPWGTLGATNGQHNLWADGDSGRDLEAMGEMYEVSGDITILTNMIHWADVCVSQRNDLMSAGNGGQRVMWTGKIDEVWCPNEPTDPNAKYAGSENEDVEGHIAYCAKLILETPSIWNNTVPDGDPFGYGATYLERATNYLSICDEANDEYSLKWFINPNTSLIVAPTNSSWTVFDENVTANNRQMMFTSGFQRLAEAHELLGDNPSRVAQYDAIVLATVNQDLTGMVNFDPYTAKGQPVYDWGYYPTTDAPESVEIHGEYDMLGVWRAYNRASYGYTLSPLIPFANTMVDVIYLGTNTFAGNVDASGGTQSPIYSGWLLTADWNPQAYTTVAGASYTNGWYKNKTDVEAGILFMKNRRYQEFSVAANPGSQIVNAGSGTSYTVTLAPLGGFTGSVTMSASGLPSGATASFNHSPVNLGQLNVCSTNITMTVSTGSSTPAGNYTITVTGTSGSVVHSDTVTLVVADYSISATPSSQTVQSGGGTTYTVNTGNNNGFSGNISLSASGLPSGANASFNPSSITAGNSSTMTITTSTTTPAGSYTITVKGTAGSDIHTNTVTLNVTDFSVSATPSSQTVTAGGSTNYTATVNAINGFSGTVTWSVNGLPNGASGNFSPATINGSGSSTLNVATSGSTPPGTYTLTVIGTSGSLQRSNTVSLVVNSAVVISNWITVNDTDSRVIYSAGWNYSTNRGDGDYNNDVHYTKTNANYAQFTFTGTAVEYITETYSDESNVDIYIDGAYQTTVNCYSTTRQAQFVAYTNTSLSAGTHTIKIVKNGGTYLLLDAFAYSGAALTDTDVGAVGIAGSASYANSIYTVTGSGTDIWNTGDQFNFDYQNATNNVTVIARVSSENGTQGFAKAAVMIRESLATNSIEASVLLTPTNGVAMELRSTTGATTANLTGWVAGNQPPTWLKLSRSGNTFTGYYSADGSTWTQLASTNVTMNASAKVGLAVTAHDNTQSNTATFDNLTIQ